jgi:hypothetical protein
MNAYVKVALERACAAILRAAADRVGGLPEIVVPRPETAGDAVANVLVWWDWGWVQATRALVTREAYGDGA